MSVKLLNEHHLEFLSSKRGCIGSSESTLVKIPLCWESHVTTHFSLINTVWIVSLYQFKHQYEINIRRGASLSRQVVSDLITRIAQGTYA